MAEVDIDERCPCCHFNTFEKGARGNHEICPVCFWEDDPAQEADNDYDGGANVISLNQARLNFRSYGAIKYEFVRYVRKPTDKEK